MTRRMRLAGWLLAGLYAAGLGVAVLLAPSPVERLVRFYLAGLPWSMLSFGLMSVDPAISPATLSAWLLTLLGWTLMTLSVLLNGLIAFALGAFVAEPRSPRSSDRAG